jgi:hypothetical protein
MLRGYLCFRISYASLSKHLLLRIDWASDKLYQIKAFIFPRSRQIQESHISFILLERVFKFQPRNQLDAQAILVYYRTSNSP